VIDVLVTQVHQGILQGLCARPGHPETDDLEGLAADSRWWLWSPVDILLEKVPDPTVDGRHDDLFASCSVVYLLLLYGEGGLTDTVFARGLIRH
jgi:hypothetical protein